MGGESRCRKRVQKVNKIGEKRYASEETNGGWRWRKGGVRRPGADLGANALEGERNWVKARNLRFRVRGNGPDRTYKE